MTNEKKKEFISYIVMFVGIFILAFAINGFFDPNGIVMGGVSGLGIVVKTLCADKFGINIPLWLTNIAFNIPLFIFALKVVGFEFIKKTLVATISLSLALYITAFIPKIDGIDNFLTITIGAALEGLGLGLVMRSSATTGGSDLLAVSLHEMYKYLSISKIMFTIDGCIIMLGFFTFGATKAMYAIIGAFIVSKVINAVLEGGSSAKAAFIISDNAEEMSDKLFAELDRGATGIYSRGMYTKKDKTMILCVVSPREMIKLKELVKQIDEKAFVIVADVREALGEGFDAI